MVPMPEDIVWDHLRIILDPESPVNKINKSTEILLKQYTPIMYQQINYYKNIRKDLRDYEDLESAARMALVKAIQKFKQGKGAKFMTFLRNGLHHELIGSFRKLVKQSLVEAVNNTTYFHKNEDSLEVADEIMNYEDPESLERMEATVEFIEDISNNADLTIGESLAFFMNYGIFCDKYNSKDTKKMFGLNKIHLSNAKLKVFYYLHSKGSDNISIAFS